MLFDTSLCRPFLFVSSSHKLTWGKTFKILKYSRDDSNFEGFIDIKFYSFFFISSKYTFFLFYSWVFSNTFGHVDLIKKNSVFLHFKKKKYWHPSVIGVKKAINKPTTNFVQVCCIHFRMNIVQISIYPSLLLFL